MIIRPVSHLDHGLSEAVVTWLLERLGERDGFFIETLQLPPELGTVPCGLHGPVMGDEPVPDSECRAEIRGTRAWESRLCDRPVRQVRTVSVIAGPHGDAPCVLYTAFGGPVAPREPGDPNITDEAERARSVSFWREHALSA